MKYVSCGLALKDSNGNFILPEYVDNGRLKSREFKSIKERFFASFEKGKKNECWLWHRTLNDSGYGRLYIGNRVEILSHRYSYMLYNNDHIEPLLVICHKCDVRNCVNPDHLFKGTKDENRLDMISKGRSKKAIGIMLPQTKLTNKDVLTIKKLLYLGVQQKDLAIKYKVSSAAIGNIYNGKSWAHIEFIPGKYIRIEV